MARENGNDLSVSGVASVDRALSVLTAFKRGDKALSLAELSRRTGLVKSTVMRLAISLEQIGFLKRLDDGQYRLDAEVLRLASIYQEQVDLDGLGTSVGARPAWLSSSADRGRRALNRGGRDRMVGREGCDITCPRGSAGHQPRTRTFP